MEYAGQKQIVADFLINFYTFAHPKNDYESP